MPPSSHRRRCAGCAPPFHSGLTSPSGRSRPASLNGATVAAIAGKTPRTPEEDNVGMIKLHSYFRSQATFRVRIALNLKGLPHESAYHHLEKGQQYAADYKALNPQMMVPTLIDGPIKLTQSMAILE